MVWGCVWGGGNGMGHQMVGGGNGSGSSRSPPPGGDPKNITSSSFPKGLQDFVLSVTMIWGVGGGTAPPWLVAGARTCTSQSGGG